jgi:hypothetical protein
MWNYNLKNRQKSGGFLLLVVTGLLTLLLVLCIGFLVAVRAQTNAVLHQRERTDLINLSYSGLDWTCAQIASRIFNGDTVAPAQYVSSAHSASPNIFPWYKDFAVNATQPKTVSGLTGWDGSSGIPSFSSKRETKWVYLPSDYILEGGLRARMAIQVLDTNAYTAINDALEDANPTQAQQALMLQGALDWNKAESVKSSKFDKLTPIATKYGWHYPAGNNLFRYADVWKLATHTLRSTVGDRYYPAGSGYRAISPFHPLETTHGTPDEREVSIVAPHSLTTNTIYFNIDGAENCIGQTQGSVNSAYMPFVSCRSYTDPDTGRAPLNINTCFNSGAMAAGPHNNGNTPISGATAQQTDLEGVFNVGALRKIIKVGSFYPNANTNLYVVTNGRRGDEPSDTTDHVIIKYLDPYLYPGNQCFDFDATTHQVKRDASGKPLLKAGVVLDPTTEGTIDPATVTIDPIDSKMSYAITSVGSGGRPFTYKSYDDLYAMLNTEEKVQVEKLKTKLAVQYQETLCRYFVASYKSHGNNFYSSTDASVLNASDVYKHYYKNYYNTYSTWLGAGGDGVANAVLNYDHSEVRFKDSPETFRAKVKADLIAMTTHNNAPPISGAWGYASLNLDGGEYVNFDATGKPEICAGKLDKRTASALFDNICPGKRLLFPSETNLEIKDPIGQLYKRRVGIDEEAINWMERVVPAAPSEPFWKPSVGATPELATLVNNKRMNNPYDYFMYTEDSNENGVLDSGEDLEKWKLDVNNNQTTKWPTDPDTGGPNANSVMDLFDAAHIDAARERGLEVWTADAANPAKGRDFLSTTGYNRFVDENIYFNTNSITTDNTASFDPAKPNCLMHPLPAVGTLVKDSNGTMVATVQSGLRSDFNANGKFDTIEYIPGHSFLDNAGLGKDLNGDGMINAYYRTPERQLVFSSDCFSTELTTTSVSYRIVVTVELCDVASVARNPAAPNIVAHSEINAVVQLAPDIEGAVTKENASDYTKADGSADKANDPGLHYYRTNQPTIRKTRTYDATTGELMTYNAKTGVQETYDPVKEAQGLQIRGGTVDENSTQNKNSYSAEHTSSARQWIDPLSVPDACRNAYYNDPHQNKRRIVIKDLMNLGSGY